MKKLLTLTLTLLALCAAASVPGQTPAGAAPQAAGATPAELARLTLKAQGAHFRDLKSLVLTGSADLYAPNSTRAVPAQFALVTAGERSRLEVQSPVFNLRHIYDGQRNFSSVRGMDLPPDNLGPSLLRRIGEPGFDVSALPDKGKTGFRISTPAGDTTDFVVEGATGRIQSFTMQHGGQSSSIDYKMLKEVSGVMVPYSFVQKVQTPQGTFYAEFKVKEAKVNQEIGDDMFLIESK